MCYLFSRPFKCLVDIIWFAPRTNPRPFVRHSTTIRPGMDECHNAILGLVLVVACQGYNEYCFGLIFGRTIRPNIRPKLLGKKLIFSEVSRTFGICQIFGISARMLSNFAEYSAFWHANSARFVHNYINKR